MNFFDKNARKYQAKQTNPVGKRIRNYARSTKGYSLVFAISRILENPILLVRITSNGFVGWLLIE